MSQAFDLLIRGGTVIDGSGAPRRRADVGIRSGRIADVGDLTDAEAAQRVDASGKIVAPGFIDAHTHDDAALLDAPGLWPKLSQGVTTVIAGNCGLSLAPLVATQVPAPLDLLGTSFRFPSFAAYLDAVRDVQPAVNAAFLVGHSTLRAACMADLKRAATAQECAQMRALVDQALDAGAIGVSTGVYYPPARAATVEEILAVCAPLKERSDAVLASHLRDEGDRVVDAMYEALDIGRALGVRCVLSHHKLVGRQNHGRTRETLGLLRHRGRLQPICLDCYPYEASSTMLNAGRALSAARVLISQSESHPEHNGRDLDDVARDWDLDRRGAVEKLLPGRAIYFSMDEADVREILAFAPTMIGSDGLPHDAVPHPRLWGSFPRVLGHYARELKLFSLETAVHKMTGLTAANFGLHDRGCLMPGLAADVTIFDEALVADRATYAEPQQPSAGIDTVIVNGRITLRAGAATGIRAGQVLTHQTRPAYLPAHT